MYVHANDKGIKERNSDYVTLMVPAARWTDVRHYGRVFSLVSSTAYNMSEAAAQVAASLLADHDDGYAPCGLESWLDEGQTVEAIMGQLLPESIVSSAGLWDQPEFVAWFCDRFEDIAERNLLAVGDGALLLSAREWTGAVECLSFDEMDERF